MTRDPRREYCSCGYSFIPSTFQRIRMLLHDNELIVRCPRCQAELTLRLSQFVYVKERKVNQKRMELWKNG